MTGQSKQNRGTEWSGLQVYLINENDKELKEYIILDNGSTLSLFGNPKLIEGIRESKTTLELATNAGTKRSNQEADVPGFGRVWYDQDTIVNVLALWIW